MDMTNIKGVFLHKDVCDFPQPLLANCGIVLGHGHDRFLQNPVQFIIRPIILRDTLSNLR